VTNAVSIPSRVIIRTTNRNTAIHAPRLSRSAAASSLALISWRMCLAALSM
jgi:hypothetical protein